VSTHVGRLIESRRTVDNKTQMYWESVGVELLGRPPADDSTIASDDTPFYRLKQAELHRLLDQVVEDSSNLVEIGSGPGGNLARAVSAGTGAVGLDVSASMLRLARQRAPFALARIDGQRLPIRDAGCDTVFTSTVLQHNTDADAAVLLAEIGRIAGRQVWLFEDTFGVALRTRASHRLRPISWYSGHLSSVGFELVSAERIRLAFQEVAATVARVVFDRGHPTGAPPSPRRLSAEERLTGAMRRLDRRIPPMLGLTAMHFRRLSNSPHQSPRATSA
jgi:SAM-dependent methyltransferase